MKLEIITIPEFDRVYKRLAKKYHSLPDDMRMFEQELTENPSVGGEYP